MHCEHTEMNAYHFLSAAFPHVNRSGQRHVFNSQTQEHTLSSLKITCTGELETTVADVSYLAIPLRRENSLSTCQARFPIRRTDQIVRVVFHLCTYPWRQGYDHAPVLLERVPFPNAIETRCEASWPCFNCCLICNSLRFQVTALKKKTQLWLRSD